ncbi:MAG: adenylate/guanylate cyclase domain-containing protein [Spirochaetales bacterium]|nr:adenylate/guanylate cyclase domain-containing protein [Spirochaetales bacterium]
MKKKEKRLKLFEIHYMGLLIGLFVFLLITLLVYGARLSFVENIEFGLSNGYYEARHKVTQETIQSGEWTRDDLVSNDIVIYGIDSETLDVLGRWPFPRAVQSDFLKTIARIKRQDSRERAVLYDFFYIEPSTPKDDAELLASIKENGRVFLETLYDWNLQNTDQRLRFYDAENALHEKYGTLGTKKKIEGDWKKLEQFYGLEPPLKQFGEAVRGYGHASYTEDRDEVYRRARLIARFSQMIDSEETRIPIDQLEAKLGRVTCDEEAYEWLGWLDQNNRIHQISEKITPENAVKLADTIRANAKISFIENKDQYQIFKFRDSFVPSIVLSLALEYFNKKPEDVEVKLGEYIRISDIQNYTTNPASGELGWVTPYELSADSSGLKKKTINEIKIPIDEQGNMLINFMGPDSTIAQTFTVNPFRRWGEPSRLKGPDPVKDRWPPHIGETNNLLIVCAYAKGMAQDEKMTPFGLMFGGEIHANALNTIIMDNFITHMPLFGSVLVLLFFIAFAALVGSRLPPLLSLGISIWCILVYYFVVQQMFISDNLLLDFTAPAMGISMTFLMVVAYRVIFEERDKRRIKSMFGKYVNPEVVEQLLQNPPELGGVDKEITVLFSDIRGFTTLSESMSPQSLVNHLNIYLTKMTDILFDYQGTLDKYVGDMLMCFWGAPLPQADHALMACKCALKQLEVLNELNKEWPPERRINVGIGINSGIMTVGNMGSPGRMNYTLMGDNVNLGSRLEGTNKAYGTTIIISEYTYGLLKDQVVVRELDNIRVKGKNKPVVIYELLDVVGGLDP